MFPNLKAEMVRHSITCKDIGELLNVSTTWVENRLQGKSVLPVDAGIKIRNAFFKNSSYEYLFSSEPIDISA